MLNNKLNHEDFDWIGLDELLSNSESELIHRSNIVYYCYNMINGKGYVGETSMQLVDRWRGQGVFNHQYWIEFDPKPLYRSIRKYGASNFKITVLEGGFTSKSDRKDAEVKWIKYLGTYYKEHGYNLTHGGGDCSQMHEASKSSRLLLYPLTNGVSPASIKAWNTAGKLKLLDMYPDTNGAPIQFMKSGLQKRLEMYPNTNGVPPENSKKWSEAGRLGLKIRYPDTNGMPTECLKAAAHAHRTDHSITDRSLATNRSNHGGVLSWNTESSIKKSLETRKMQGDGDPMYGCHTESARIKSTKGSRLTKLFNSIKNRVDHLVGIGIELSIESYLTGDSWSDKRHLSRLIPMIPDMINDPRWDPKYDFLKILVK